MRNRFFGGGTLSVVALINFISIAAANAMTGEEIAALPYKKIPPEKALAISAPRPEYPLVARENRWTGSGLAVVAVDVRTGVPTRAYIVKSTGHRVLDQSALAAYRRWRFKPHTVSKVKLPFTFTISGNY